MSTNPVSGSPTIPQGQASVAEGPSQQQKTLKNSQSTMKPAATDDPKPNSSATKIENSLPVKSLATRIKSIFTYISNFFGYILSGLFSPFIWVYKQLVKTTPRQNNQALATVIKENNPDDVRKVDLDYIMKYTVSGEGRKEILKYLGQKPFDALTKLQKVPYLILDKKKISFLISEGAKRLKSEGNLLLNDPVVNEKVLIEMKKKDEQDRNEADQTVVPPIK